MRLKLVVLAVAAFCLLAAPSFAADIDGTWVAEMQFRGGPGGGGPGGGGQEGPRLITFDLKADGAVLTGKVKNQRGENDIVDGKIDGNNVSFAVKRTGMQGNEMTIKYDGTLSGDELTLKMSFGGMGGGMGGGPGGGGMEMPPLVAKRQK